MGYEMQWRQLDHYANNLHLAPHHSNFYRPDALPDIQPTVSEQRTECKDINICKKNKNARAS